MILYTDACKKQQDLGDGIYKVKRGTIISISLGRMQQISGRNMNQCTFRKASEEKYKKLNN